MQRHGVRENDWVGGDGITPLILASINNHTPVTKELLLFEQIDPNMSNRRGDTALHYACEKGHESVVKALIQHPRIDPNTMDSLGWTPAFKASKSGHAECVRILLKNKDININHQDAIGYTALIKACECGETDVVRVLLEHDSIDTTIKDKYSNKTALDIAYQQNKTEKTITAKSRRPATVQVTNWVPVPARCCNTRSKLRVFVFRSPFFFAKRKELILK